MSERTPLRGAKLLRDWRSGAGLSQHDASERIGIDIARYNAWEKDRARPGLDWAIRVEDVTDGNVPARSWTEEEPSDSETTDAREAGALADGRARAS